jgi:hypothetical protein
LDRGFLFSSSILPNWQELKCQLSKKYICFVLCGMAGFGRLWGLDKNFRDCGLPLFKPDTHLPGKEGSFDRGRIT